MVCSHGFFAWPRTVSPAMSSFFAMEGTPRPAQREAMVGDPFTNAYTFQIPGFNLGINCITFGYLTGKYIAENE